MEASVELAPSPWSLVGCAWWFLYLNNSTTPLDDGHYDPLEQLPTDGSHGVFKGGLANAQIVRYTDSPVGPYDELMIIPGKFTNPINGEQHVRITRIYVSSERSVHNGRRNWSIPKHFARFEFTSDPASSSTTIKVYPPSPPDAPPFFAATTSPIKYIPSMPFKTSWSPLDLALVQPPLPSIADLEESDQNPKDASHAPRAENPKLLIGSKGWSSILPDIQGNVRFVRFSPVPGLGLEVNGIPQYGDGVGFPRFKPWSVGIEWMEGTKLVFPVAEKIESKSDESRKHK